MSEPTLEMRLGAWFTQEQYKYGAKDILAEVAAPALERDELRARLAEADALIRLVWKLWEEEGVYPMGVSFSAYLARYPEPIK